MRPPNRQRPGSGEESGRRLAQRARVPSPRGTPAATSSTRLQVVQDVKRLGRSPGFRFLLLPVLPTRSTCPALVGSSAERSDSRSGLLRFRPRSQWRGPRRSRTDFPLGGNSRLSTSCAAPLRIELSKRNGQRSQSIAGRQTSTMDVILHPTGHHRRSRRCHPHAAAEPAGRPAAVCCPDHR